MSVKGHPMNISEVHDTPLKPAKCVRTLWTHFECFKTSSHFTELTWLFHLPHACAPQWVPIVWCVSTGPLYVSASCSTVYKSSPLARESLEFSLWIFFARLVILCTYVTFTYKNFGFPLPVLCIMWNVRLPLQCSCIEWNANLTVQFLKLR